MKFLSSTKSYFLLLFTVLFILSCQSEKKTVKGFYRGFGNLGYSYINAHDDFQVQFSCSDVFLVNPDRRHFKTVYTDQNLLRRINLLRKNIIYISTNNVLSVNLRALSLYKMSVANYQQMFLSILNQNKDIKKIRKVDKVDLPANISKYRNVVYEYELGTVRVIDLLIERESSTFRFTYFLAAHTDTSETIITEALLDSHLRPELATINLSYQRDLEKKFSIPLLGALSLFRESNSNYLFTVNSIEKLRTTLADKPEFHKIGYAHAKKLFYSFVGKSVPLAYEDSRLILPKSYRFAPDSNSYEPTNAISTIAAIAKNVDVIMLNESHNDPRCREFATSILDSLSKKGFKYLFVEALADSLINQRKYPLMNSGVYTSEPMFSNFLRKAIALGFTICAYESEGKPGETREERERQQAYNINQVLSNDPGAKALVYAGHGHINKVINRMAYLFDSISAKRSFCINQAVNDEAPQSVAFYNGNIHEPSIYRSKRDSSFLVAEEEYMQVDATVIFPKQKADHSDILSAMIDIGDKRYHCSFKGRKFEGKIFQLKYKTEAAQTSVGGIVPISNILLKRKNDIQLQLPSGSYYIDILDEYNNRLYFKELQL